MKKIILTAMTVMLATVYSYSQTDQGNLFLSGTFNINTSTLKTKLGSNSTDGPKTFSFGLIPVGGYFIADNLMLGMGLGYTLDKTTQTSDGTGGQPDKSVQTQTMFNFVPMARYYIFPVKKLGLFVQGSFSAGFGKDKLEDTYTINMGGGVDSTFTASTDGKQSGIMVGVKPGLVYFVGSSVALEVAFGGLYFQSQTVKYGSGENEMKMSTSGFGLEANRQPFSFGVSVHL